MDRQSILEALSTRPGEEVAALLNDALATDLSPQDAAWAYYILGRVAWKDGKVGAAITFYNKAIELDPDSEAFVARAQANQILNFYNKDLYNP